MKTPTMVLALGLVLLGGSFRPAPAAEGNENLVFCSGTVSSHGAEELAYLVWQATDDALLNRRAVAIYAKPGDFAAPGTFSLVGVAEVQTDERTLELLCARAQKVGEDLSSLETSLDSYFQELILTNTLSLPSKLSSVVRGSLGNPDEFGNLVFMARVHPAIGLAIGRAFVVSIPTNGSTSFEFRDYDSSLGQSGAVFGRVCLVARQPPVLPAPTNLVEVVEPSAKGSLNARFRWDSTPDLDRASLLGFGYNLWRVSRAYALAHNYHLVPPTPATLSANANVVRVNRSPILIDDENVTPETYYFVDDNSYSEGVPHAFTNGAQFYYFVSARDLLGRDGLVSQGIPVTLCDRMPPPAPGQLRTSPYRRYQGGASVQGFSLKWNPVVVTNEGESIAGYYVYRHTNFNALLYGSPAPISALLPHTNNATPHSFTDTNFLSTDATRTFWYVVRAIDNSACGGNLSPNSSPAFGVVRDWQPPKPPTNVVVSLICEDVDLYWTYETPRNHKPEDRTTNFTTRVTVTRLPTTNGVSGIEWTELSAKSDKSTNTFAERRYYRPGSSNVVFEITLDPNDSTRICVAAGSVNGRTSATLCKTLQPVDDGYYWDVGAEARTVYTRRPAGQDCDRHVSRIPGSDENEDLVTQAGVQDEPGDEWAQEWRGYLSLNGGEPTLVAQGIITNSADQIAFTNEAPGGIHGGEVCIYLQYLDRHGNPGAMHRIKCVEVTPIVPPPQPILVSLEDAFDSKNGLAQMKATWTCPPYGVERFMLSLFSDPLASNPDVGTNVFLVDGMGMPGIYYYRTGRLGGDFSAATSATHVAWFNVQTGTVYTLSVAAEGRAGSIGLWSDPMDFQLGYLGTNDPGTPPQVPWPARPFPPVQPISFDRANAPFTPADDVYWPGQSDDPGQNGNLPGGGTFSTPDGSEPKGEPFHGGLLESANEPLLGGNDVVAIGIGEISGKGVSGSPGDYIVEEPGKGTNSVNPVAYLYRDAQSIGNTTNAAETILPCVLYRMQISGPLLADASGDVVQVSPLIEEIAYQDLGPVPAPARIRILDPFIALSRIGGETGNYSLSLVDTQPVVRGASYRYMIVRFTPDGELDRIFPVVNTITIPE